MTFEEKKGIEQGLMVVLNAIAQNNIATDAILYIHADNQFQQASLNVLGDARLLANAIQHHIHTNPDFRKFMFATIGSYLSKNPDVKKEFDEGMQLLENSFGIN